MQKTRVVHCKREPYDVYIGRPSLFRNNFRIGLDGTREEVIEKFRAEFEVKILDPIFAATVKKLKGKTLGCWCKPKACHGDVIVEYLEG